MSLPEFVTPQLVTSVITIFAMVHVILLGCAYCILLERKLSAWMQDRVGPNRVGPLGLLQPIADGIKFLLKEDYTPGGVDKALFIAAPAMVVVPALIAFAVIPWAGTLDLSTLPTAIVDALGIGGQTVNIVGAEVNIGVIYLVAVASMGVYGVAIGGWASNSKYSFLGGLRASAQMLSYEIPMGLAILTVILFAGTLMPGDMIRQQIEGGWNIIHLPLAALLFYICRLAEANRAPFDMAEAEAELVGGYHTEYSSMKFALFFLAEYAHMITGGAFIVVLFLGGWSINPLPWGPDLPEQGGLLLILLQVSVVLFKIFLIISLDMAVRWTLPRLRYDQLMKLSWEGLIPIGLVLTLLTSVVVYLGAQSWMWLVSIGCFALIWLVHPHLPKQPNPNRRIGIAGSRFSPLRDDTTTTPNPLLANQAPPS